MSSENIPLGEELTGLNKTQALVVGRALQVYLLGMGIWVLMSGERMLFNPNTIELIALIITALLAVSIIGFVALSLYIKRRRSHAE